ncbi:MAG: acetyl-CoA carboxylase biotin carboxyl carrier protein [Phycisphaerales bacterium]|nr:MAG: acetyl-CoA carboxylase biotin carboxyl carrier protein [Phycisphaerales bacterium]
MIDIRKLKELVRLMVSNDLTELDLRDNEEQVTLRRSSVNAMPQVTTMPVAAQAAPAPAAASSNNNNAASPAPAETKAADGDAAPSDTGLHRIESPMVGTFYTAPNPDAEPFVKVGQQVDSETVVCVIEAMKIFNEIKAECSGTIEKVLVKNAESVEFGQPLFLVKPD